MSSKPARVKEVPLGGSGKVALVDEEDFERVSQYSWWLFDGYAVTTAQSETGRKTVRLHRFVLNAPPNQQVDHKNRDGLDCRKANLRLATRSQNQFNRPKSKNNTSGYKGVAPVSRGYERWQAQIKVNGVRHFLGQFGTPEEAARAYDRMAKEYHGEFACLNFPEEG